MVLNYSFHHAQRIMYLFFICLLSPFLGHHGGIDYLPPAAPHVHTVYFSNTRGSYRACCDSCSKTQLNVAPLPHPTSPPFFHL